MPSLAKQRRTWFALLRELGIDDADRRAVQEAHVPGKPSLRTWSPADFDQAIAALQRATGQHRDRHAHIRNDAAPSIPSMPSTDMADGWATQDQARYIEDLCDRIYWRTGRQVGPSRYAAHTVLKGPGKALRSKQLEYNGCAPRPARLRAWQRLTRAEASDLIKALRKLAQVNPLLPWRRANA